MGKITFLEIKTNHPLRNFFSLLLTVLLQLSLTTTAKAEFTNGGFESPYTPGTTTNAPITDWTTTGFRFNGNATNATPTSISGISLNGTVSPQNIGIIDIYDATNPDYPNDYFLEGATPIPTLIPVGNGLQSASVNLRSGHAPFAHSGDNAPEPPGQPEWTAIARQATSIRQQITVQPSDIDPIDGKVHVRFIAAPVLDTDPDLPVHQVKELPFFAIQLNNITTGRIGANPLFFQWNYSSQPGVPWKTVTASGTNPGAQVNDLPSYQYMGWQSFDIAPGNAFIRVGDTIEFVAIASGCSVGGHEGHVYVDDVGTARPARLLVNVTGPASTTPGSTVTYTYSYTNNSSVPVTNVTVAANLPQGTPPLNGDGSPGSVTPAQNTTYVSNTNPTTGSCSGSGPVTCNVGTLQPGQSGTFTVTVAIPGTWATAPDGVNTSGPVNNGNYPISGDSVAPVLGPLVQTALVAPTAVSNLVANASGMPTTFTPGTPYTGSFTCSNASNLSASGDAPDATCDITNLPPGLAISQCTISPSGAIWTQPSAIPANQTVTCAVSGTPTTAGAFTANVSTNAPNNSNSTTNIATAPIASGGTGVNNSDMVASSSSLPTIASINSVYTGSFTCTNNSAVTATSVSCGMSGLPNGVSVTSCSSPTQSVWVDGSSLLANGAVTCRVSGKPTIMGRVTATVITSASNQINTSNDRSPITIEVTDKLAIPATLNGKRVLSAAIACCGRPVILGNLPGPGKTTYRITARTGNVRCAIKRSMSKTFLKINGSRGSCTVVGNKNGADTLPLTIRTPRSFALGN